MRWKEFSSKVISGGFDVSEELYTRVSDMLDNGSKINIDDVEVKIYKEGKTVYDFDFVKEKKC